MAQHCSGNDVAQHCSGNDVAQHCGGNDVVNILGELNFLVGQMFCGVKFFRVSILLWVTIIGWSKFWGGQNLKGQHSFKESHFLRGCNFEQFKLLRGSKF